MSFRQLKAWRNDIKHDPSRTAASMKEESKACFMLAKLLDNGRSSEAYVANEGSTNYCTVWFSWRRNGGSSVLMFQRIGKDVAESTAILIASDVRFAQSPYVSVDGNGLKLISFMGYVRSDEERIRKILMAMPRDERECADYWLEDKVPYFYIAKVSADNKILIEPRLVNESEDALDTLDSIESISDGDLACHIFEFKRDNRSLDPVHLTGDTAGNVYILRSDPGANLTYPLEADIFALRLLLMKANLDNGYVSEKEVFACVKIPLYGELYFDDEQNIHVMVWSENRFLHKVLDQTGEILEEERTVFHIDLDDREFIAAATGPDPNGDVKAILVDSKIAWPCFTGRSKYRATLFPLHVKAKYCRDEYAVLGKNLQIIRLRYDRTREIRLSVH